MQLIRKGLSKIVKALNMVEVHFLMVVQQSRTRSSSQGPRENAFSRTNPIKTPLGLNKDLTLPQCRRLLNLHSWPATLETHTSSSALTPRDIEPHTFTIRDRDPEVVVGFIYCPELLIPQAALTRTLYASLRAISHRATSEGYHALLGRPFASQEELGVNCMITFSPSDSGGRVSVGAVADVLVFLRRWMVRQQHYGAVTFAVYVDNNKS
ncbi:MAG: hypothetical protein L6R38_002233 [Xanthoria sp. 2 TBL-2021]|nr:MAG: hypothetical protein L6R38_002233 [Xanthoria sp. 2 TBL-2021]